MSQQDSSYHESLCARGQDGETAPGTAENATGTADTTTGAEENTTGTAGGRENNEDCREVCKQAARSLLDRIVLKLNDPSCDVSVLEFKRISGAIKDILDITNDDDSENRNVIEVIMGEAQQYINGSRT